MPEQIKPTIKRRPRTEPAERAHVECDEGVTDDEHRNHEGLTCHVVLKETPFLDSLQFSVSGLSTCKQQHPPDPLTDNHCLKLKRTGRTHTQHEYVPKSRGRMSPLKTLQARV